MSSSEDRRSFYGIAETWVAPGDGKQKPFAFNAKTMSAFCDIAFLGDVNVIITLSAACTVDGGNLDIIETMLVGCSISLIADVTPLTTTMGAAVTSIVVTTP